jgi:hypothetical protein
MTRKPTTGYGLSISALARSLHRNWRTVAAACSSISPVGRDGKTPLYDRDDVAFELSNVEGLSGHAREICRGQLRRPLTAEEMALRERVWDELVALGVFEEF